MVRSTSATGAPRHLEPHSDDHSNVEQEMQRDTCPAAARVGQDGTWVCRAKRDGAMAGGGSGATGTGSGWDAVEADEGFTTTCLPPWKCKTFVRYLVWFFNTSLFIVSNCVELALKCRLKALMKYRTPQKDNLNFCHFKLCMAGMLEQPPRLMSCEFK